MTRIITVAGALAQKPGHGGHTWVFLQYLLGFKRLGWDVLFLDELQPAMCVDEAGAGCSLERSENLRYFLDVMERFGLRESFALIYNRGERLVGLSRGEVVERVKRSAFLLNVMGYLSDQEILAQARRRVFLDIDPGFGQMWRELGLSNVFKGHDTFVTIGENIGRPDCAIPTCGLEWITTPQPVVLEHWQGPDEGRGVRGEGTATETTPPGPPFVRGGGVQAFTSIGAWRGQNGPIEYKGRTYGLRCHEFRKFVGLARLCPATQFEMALDIHQADVKDIELLRNHGWSLIDPKAVAGGPAEYGDYLARSKAEFMVAKNLYVDTHSGWFSDRSICYLASGRPVLAQDTGIKHLVPTGEGLLTFSTLEEAAAGVETINGDYARHCQAAREIAVEYFDSDKVLTRLLDKLGVGGGKQP